MVANQYTKTFISAKDDVDTIVDTLALDWK